MREQRTNMKDPRNPGAERDNNSPVLPDVAVDHKANAKKFKDEWLKLKENDERGRTSIPGTRRSVEFTHVEVTDNVVSIWTSSDKSLSPDFVIVNPPISADSDPLTDIAIVIDGAS